MDNPHDNQSGGPATSDQPSEQEMRAAYEAELNRITSSEMILQTAVSLLNIGGRRLGLGRPPGADQPTSGSPGGERDLEQVRDAIDAVSALLPILERRMPGELGPLRDAIAQLQVAYARESSPTSPTTSTAGPSQTSTAGTGASAGPQDAPSKPTDGQGDPAGTDDPSGGQQDGTSGPGPAQASGRLWVPGR